MHIRFVTPFIIAMAVGVGSASAQNAPAQAPPPTTTTTTTQTTQAGQTTLAGAFPTFEVTGGYQFLRIPDQSLPFGLNLDGAWNRNSALGLVGELGWAMGSDDDDTLGSESSFHAWNFGIGPRFTMRGDSPVWPYVQVLAGGLHLRGSTEIGDLEFDDSRTGFMLQPGAGINFTVADGLGFVGQVDYRRVFFGDGDDIDDEDDDGDGQNQFRVFVGLRLLLD